MDPKESLVFASVDEALRYLSNVMGARVVVANLDGPVTADEEEEDEKSSEE